MKRRKLNNRPVKFDVFLHNNPRQSIKELFQGEPERQVEAPDLESAREKMRGLFHNPVLRVSPLDPSVVPRSYLSTFPHEDRRRELSRR